jgi:hypothetical protein
VTHALPWVADGNKQRCTLHDVTFPKTRTCPQCAIGGPPIRLAREQLPPPPKGCLSTVAIERWYVELAKESAASASDVEQRANAKGKGILVETGEEIEVLVRNFHDETAIAKHREIAIKAMRAANELATRREDDEIVDIRDERSRGGSH